MLYCWWAHWLWSEGGRVLLDALFRSKSLENPSTPITGDAVDTDG
ncbi:phage portal protein, partial [Escherichia coli]